MSTPFEYQGTLEETYIAEMFWTIYRHRVPGKIEVRHEGIVKQVVIRGGDIIYASSNDKSDRLGAHLYRLGRLDRQELVETMRERETSGKRHGQLLIEDRTLSPKELCETIHSQMKSIVWSLFAWQRGSLSFKIGEFDDPSMLKIHLPMRLAIARGIKKAPDAKALVARLGKKATVFKPTYQTEDLIEIALDEEEYALLTMVDGKRSLYELCTSGPYGVSENARLLYAYRVLHLIEPKPLSGSGSIKIRM